MTLLPGNLPADVSGLLRRPDLVLHHLRRGLRDPGRDRDAGRDPGLQHQDLLCDSSSHGGVAGVRHGQRPGHGRAGAERRARLPLPEGARGRARSTPRSPDADTVPRSSTLGGPGISGSFFFLPLPVVWRWSFRWWSLGWGSLLTFYQPPSWELVPQLTAEALLQRVDELRCANRVQEHGHAGGDRRHRHRGVSVIAGWIIVRFGGRMGRVLNLLTFAPIAIPSVIIGMALILVYLSIPIGGLRHHLGHRHRPRHAIHLLRLPRGDLRPGPGAQGTGGGLLHVRRLHVRDPPQGGGAHRPSGAGEPVAVGGAAQPAGALVGGPAGHSRQSGGEHHDLVRLAGRAGGRGLRPFDHADRRIAGDRLRGPAPPDLGRPGGDAH